MAIEFEFISPTDKPALVCVSDPELKDLAAVVLQELGYRVHQPSDHNEFTTQFVQIQYQVVLLDALFGTATPSDNETLLAIQNMPMHQRRHAVFILIGRDFKTLDALQAFTQSVHAVVNPDDLGSLGQIILKVVADNDLFLHIYRDTQTRIAQGA